MSADLVRRLRTACSPTSPLGILCTEAADTLEALIGGPDTKVAPTAGEPTEADKRINQRLGYPMYQEGQPLAPGQQYACEHDWRSAANGGSQCLKCAVYMRDFGEPGGAGGTEYRFPRGKRKGKK